MLEKRGGYLRFRNSLVLSISMTYVNPFSSRSVASLMFVAALHVYSSSSFSFISWV